MQERGAGRPPGAVTVRARRRGTVTFGCLTALWLLALAAAGNAQPAASGRVEAGVADGEEHTSLVAAVFEDIGDKIFRTARASAREAYRRAASAQRAFAGYAPSPPENAARLAEAARIGGKVQN